MSKASVELLKGLEAATNLKDEWRELQKAHPELASPYYCPEFVQCVADARDDVHVAVIRERDKIVTLFPFQRGESNMGEPVGNPLSDYHGLIGRHDKTISIRAIVNSCRLREWRYDHLPQHQSAFDGYHRNLAVSPYIETNQSYDDFVAGIKARSSEYSQAQRKLRKLERERGAIRFERSNRNSELLELLIDWKSEQYQRTGAIDRFQEPWFRNVVENVFAHDSDAFQGILSVLYVDEKPAAIHFGMLANGVWHYWFPAYSAEYSRYSPGLNLLLKMTETACADENIGIIDLGKGKRVRYKEMMKSGEIALADGAVHYSALRNQWRRLRLKLSKMRKPSP